MEARQEPTYKQLNKEIAYTEADYALPLFEQLGYVAKEWQRLIVTVALARDERDKYLYREVGISVPRQNGKSFIVYMICVYCALVLGERVAYTAHRNDTADEMFTAVAKILEGDDVPPDVAAEVDRVRHANGQWGVYFKNGGYIKFTTRSSGLGRGRGFERLILDEAQDLTASELASMASTLSANKNKNAQVIYLGTPPDPESAGEVFEGMHNSVHNGESPNTAWFEWSVDEPGDKHDESRWYVTNPSLDDLLDIEYIREVEAARLDNATFARERLGWWQDTGSYEKAIDSVAWGRCVVDMAPQCGKVAYGVKFSATGRHAALCAAVQEDGERPHVELVHVFDVTHGMYRLAQALYSGVRTASCFIVDGKGNAETLAQRVMDLGAPRDYCVVAKTRDVIQAAASMADAVLAHEVTHIEEEKLDFSVCNSAKRPIGKDAWGIGDGPRCDSTPAQAASLALLAVTIGTRDPNYEQEVAFF